MTKHNYFTLELLQAINDWQISSNSKRGKKLKGLALHLPQKYKQCNSVCYRKLDLKKDAVFSLLGRLRLNEKISSWSLSEQVVKEFKHGVSKKQHQEQSIILWFIPSPSDVVVNLNEIYNCSDFKNAVNLHHKDIDDYDKGIKYYANSQVEVILDVEYVTDKNIYLLGGRSGSFPANTAPTIYKRKEMQLQYDIDTNRVYVFKWLSQSQSQDVLIRVRNKVSVPYNVYAKRYGYFKK